MVPGNMVYLLLLPAACMALIGSQPQFIVSSQPMLIGSAPQPQLAARRPPQHIAPAHAAHNARDRDWLHPADCGGRLWTPGRGGSGGGGWVQPRSSGFVGVAVGNLSLFLLTASGAAYAGALPRSLRQAAAAAVEGPRRHSGHRKSVFKHSRVEA